MLKPNLPRISVCFIFMYVFAAVICSGDVFTHVYEFNEINDEITVDDSIFTHLPEDIEAELIPPDMEKLPDLPDREPEPEPEPEKPVIPPIPEYIMGEGLIPGESLSAFLLYHNPGVNDMAAELAGLYVEEALAEGINHDVSFAQMCLETGYLAFGGLVIPEMNNFCGLGSIGPGQNGAWFPDPRTGVRAHIQHLKVYASKEPLTKELVDPRFHLVRPGSSPKISGLAGTWAADKFYAEKINTILERLYRFFYLDEFETSRYYIIDESDFIDPIPEKPSEINLNEDESDESDFSNSMTEESVTEIIIDEGVTE